MRTGVDEGVIGRDHPVAALRAEIGRATASHGGLVLVTGEAGIGKTALVTQAAQEARRGGVLVVGGSCWDSDSAPGYWPWVQVMRMLRRGDAGEWAAAREAGGIGLAVLLGERRGEDDEQRVDAFALYDAVTGALVAVSRQRPVMVVLDDLHGADPASLRLLTFAAQHTWFERVLLVGTYRDVEVEATDHPLRPLMTPLVAKATTLTLTGLGRDDVGNLIARTAGRRPDAAIVDEIHRRTGGNPFFVEQTARLWRADGETAAVAPGVRDAVRQRLSRLPPAVDAVLTAAAVLGREFHRQVLAAAAAQPAARVDRLLDQAATARLVGALGGGRFRFAHDLVRETLYDGLDEPTRRRAHAAVIRAVDDSPRLAERLFQADLARHAYLAGAELPAARAVDLLAAAGRDASARMSTEEAITQFERALEVVDDPRNRARVTLELGQMLFHRRDRDDAWAQLARAADEARALDDVELLTRVALTAYRNLGLRRRRLATVDALLREARRRLIGEDADPGASHERLVRDLVAGAELRARGGADDEALAFALWARHDTIWGLGTARERDALTVEMGEVARRSGNVETELFAASLRWVALVEQGDPGYLDQLHTFVALAERQEVARWRFAAAVDRSIVALMRGEFDAAQAHLKGVDLHADRDDSDVAYMGFHVRWTLSMLRGRWDDVDAQLAGAAVREHPFLELARCLTAVERGDAGPALRHIAASPAYPRYMTPLWLRLLARTAAVTGDAMLADEARTALAPHRGQWLVSLFGCDVSGPVDLWIAVADAASGRWDEAVEGFTAARDGAERMGARPWSLIARAGLADALAGRGDTAAAAALRSDVEREGAEIGMPQLASPHRVDLADTVPAKRAEAASGQPGLQDRGRGEFRREGDVWRLAYEGRVVHLPDAKGLRDLHTLLQRPGVDLAAVELLDPAAGPELVAARRMGGDPVLDDEAKASYRRRLDQLDDAIDRATEHGDPRAADAYANERAALLDELRAAAGLAGCTRRLGDEAERARKTVTARIRDTLRKLDERHPALAAHLRASVSTGATCRYAPPAPVAWHL